MIKIYKHGFATSTEYSSEIGVYAAIVLDLSTETPTVQF